MIGAEVGQGREIVELLNPDLYAAVAEVTVNTNSNIKCASLIWLSGSQTI